MSGNVYGMQRTTVYLPDDLKRALEQVAAARGCSEAALVREAIRTLTMDATPPRPRLPLFRSGKARLAERVDTALAEAAPGAVSTGSSRSVRPTWRQRVRSSPDTPISTPADR